MFKLVSEFKTEKCPAGIEPLNKFISDCPKYKIEKPVRLERKIPRGIHQKLTNGKMID